jgi:hypothetical protein
MYARSGGVENTMWLPPRAVHNVTGMLLTTGLQAARILGDLLRLICRLGSCLVGAGPLSLIPVAYLIFIEPTSSTLHSTG